MQILIAALGVVVAAFGIVVLVRYHDRPGGTLKWLGMELSSTGAGLPLVALGVLAVIAATAVPPIGGDKPELDTNGAKPKDGGLDSAAVDVTNQPVRDSSHTSVVDTIVRSFVISETNDDHKAFETNTKPYAKGFRADSGYKIIDYRWDEDSATRQSDLVINILEGGDSIHMSFYLKAGPKTDRYRGWLRGTLVTTQVRRVALIRAQ